MQQLLLDVWQSLGTTVLFVTHDIDEAILLSDRIVMMTNGPAATIGEVCDVALNRPRRRLQAADTAEYARCRKQVLQFLYERHAQIGDKAA